MQTVDRQGFIMWINGELLHFENGVGCIAPERDCVAAEKALENGEKIALTNKGRIVSYLEPVNNEWVEKLI